MPDRSYKHLWLFWKHLPNKNIGVETLVHTDIEYKSSYQWILRCDSLQMMLTGKIKFRKNNGLNSKSYFFSSELFKAIHFKWFIYRQMIPVERLIFFKKRGIQQLVFYYLDKRQNRNTWEKGYRKEIADCLNAVVNWTRPPFFALTGRMVHIQIFFPFYVSLKSSHLMVPILEAAEIHQ